MYYVIGSGPSGIAGAAALINAGRRVTLIDAGLRLEAEREALRLRMARREPEDWRDEELSGLRTPVGPKGAVDAKFVHGSDYVYRSIKGEIAVDYGQLGARGSFAEGGLSNVWGAALLPFRQQDMEDWPVTTAELVDSHAAVLQMLPVAGARDDLLRLLPLHADRVHEPRRSRQIERLMRNLVRSSRDLAQKGVVFGAARLAVRFSGNSASDSCNYCGRCMHGCPRDLIYSSRHTLDELVASGKLTYVRGVVVNRIVEHTGSVAVYGSDESGVRRFDAERVFLAAGVFNSTAILLRSLGWYNRPVDIADSQHFVFPLLHASAAPDVARERLHTLAQTFVEILDEAISPYTVHLQVYGFNDLLTDILKRKLGLLWHCFPRNLLLGRFLFVQAYLHSAHSGRIRATLRRRNEADTLELEGIESPETRDRISRTMRKLRRLSPAMRAFPISPLLKISEPGRGFHSGGSFPMARNPRPGQADTLGRPFGCSRTHVIDATVLPSIPATTITQTLMANAFRIATASAKLDPRKELK